MCIFLKKECKFNFCYEYMREFEELKAKLVSTPIIISLNWGQQFEIMCDASGVTIGVVLGQR